MKPKVEQIVCQMSECEGVDFTPINVVRAHRMTTPSSCEIVLQYRFVNMLQCLACGAIQDGYGDEEVIK